MHPALTDTDVLLLDLDGTVLDFRASQREAYRASLAELGLAWHPGHQDLWAAVNHGLWRSLERGEIDGPTLRRRRWPQLFEALGVDHPDPDGFSERYLERFRAGAHLLPGAREAMVALTDRFRLVILTNGFADVQHHRIDRAGLRELVEAVVVSDEVGVPKPDPAVFEATFDAIGRPPRDRVVMVGDSLTSDIAGGIGYGLRTVWINPERRPHPGGQRPTHEVRALAELLG